MIECPNCHFKGEEKDFGVAIRQGKGYVDVGFSCSSCGKEFGFDMVDFDHICENCGLTYGAHRADTFRGQCPQHEGGMDWPKENITTFEDSGEIKEIPLGTNSKLFKEG